MAEWFSPKLEVNLGFHLKKSSRSPSTGQDQEVVAHPSSKSVKPKEFHEASPLEHPTNSEKLLRDPSATHSSGQVVSCECDRSLRNNPSLLHASSSLDRSCSSRDWSPLARPESQASYSKQSHSLIRFASNSYWVEEASPPFHKQASK